MGMHCKTKCWTKCWTIVPLVLAGIAALSYVVMLLWNWLLPALFDGVHEIGYLQALGVLVLSKILFGGLRGHGCRGRWHGHRWAHMTPEEREKFQAGMSGCGGGKCADIDKLHKLMELQERWEANEARKAKDSETKEKQD